jgi:hypothetical protein
MTRVFLHITAAVVLLVLAAACEQPAPPTPPPPAPPKPEYLLPPEPKGAEFVTLEIAPPSGNAGRLLLAGLEQNSRVVARGQANIAPTGTTEVVMRLMDGKTKIQVGECDLWLVIDRDDMPASRPSVGDKFLRDTWHWPRVGRVMSYWNPKAWQLKGLSRASNLVTVHYHRSDGDYENMGILSRDANRLKSPQENELREVGRDEYGPIFQFDRDDYGSEKIGLLPRWNADGGRTDGEEKFWLPEMGEEIYMIGGKPNIWSKKPDIRAETVASPGN